MSMTEELQKRAEQKPDQWTIAWWSKQFQECLASNRGLKHALHLALAEMEDLGKTVRELKETVVLMASSADQDRAMIGQLRERLDKAAEVVKELSKPKKQTAGSEPAVSSDKTPSSPRPSP